MTLPTVRSMLPRLVVPVAPLYHWIITLILGQLLLLGACFFGIYIQKRIDAHQIASLNAVIQAKDEQLAGKKVADGLTQQARKRERMMEAKGQRQ